MAAQWLKPLLHHLASAPASQCCHSFVFVHFKYPKIDSGTLSFLCGVLSYIPGTNDCFCLASAYKVAQVLSGWLLNFPPKSYYS